jgi:hypothetical protein
MHHYHRQQPRCLVLERVLTAAAAAAAGVQGDRNALHTLNMTLTQPPSKDGFAVTVESPARWGYKGYALEFNPPCLVR